MRVSTNEIKTLSKMRSKLALSIYIKMEQGLENVDKNRIHLKNTLKDIMRKAQKAGYSNHELTSISRWIMNRALEEERFINGDGRTLVIFASDGIFKIHFLYEDFEEQYYAGVEFVTLPLSRVIERDHRFVINAEVPRVFA